MSGKKLLDNVNDALHMILTFHFISAYIVKWELQYFRTGIRHLKGGKSKQEDRGVDRSVFFFWQGSDCSASDKGTAALMTVDLDTEDGPQVREYLIGQKFV